MTLSNAHIIRAMNQTDERHLATAARLHRDERDTAPVTHLALSTLRRPATRERIAAIPVLTSRRRCA